jgi:hypothetical protein
MQTSIELKEDGETQTQLNQDETRQTPIELKEDGETQTQLNQNEATQTSVEEIPILKLLPTRVEPGLTPEQVGKVVFLYRYS